MATNGTHPTTAPPQPLNILIVGAGLGGLFAAIALRTAGHHCTIYESSRFATETGAAIHLPSNVNGLLRRYGLIPEAHGANQCKWVTELKGNGEQVFSSDVRGLAFAFPYPWQLCHRIDLHNALKGLATGEAGKGRPAVIHLQSRVKEVDCEGASITLQSGEVVKGDLVIGADGVHSVTRNFVLGETKQPRPSGTSAFRFLIPTSTIEADPSTAHFVSKKGEMTMISSDTKRLVMYPCRGNTEQNFVGLHLDEGGHASSEDWNQSASKESLLRVFGDYQGDVKALLEKAEPETIKLWKLLDMEALPSWTKGRTTLIGDAAHPFLPHQGQGGAQAMEDAAALAALLPLGTTVDDLPQRLALYRECRYQRASMIQEYSRHHGFIEEGKPPSKRLMEPMQFTGFNFDHDAHDHATGVLRKHLAMQGKFHRMPSSFGPVPSPRQGLDGKSRIMNPDARYTTAFVTFKTKKSYLQTLMPSPELNIQVRGGWATATYVVTQFSNLAWLGGRGYTFFGLWVHSVVKGNPNAPPTDPPAKTGDVIPILFENMADPIITGREELGMPKAYATLETKHSGGEYHAKAGWEGTSFCEFKLEELVAEEDAERVQDAETFLPAAAAGPATEGTKAAAAGYELVTAMQMGGSGKEKRWKAGKASVQFTQMERAELERAFPTLANVIEGLRGIEVGQIVTSGIKASL